MVSAVAGFVKVRYLIDKAIIDNMVFRMHYRSTSALLFLFCILVTANNLIGESILSESDQYLYNFNDKKLLTQSSGKILRLCVTISSNFLRYISYYVPTYQMFS